jgi:hypothetical protein
MFDKKALDQTGTRRQIVKDFKLPIPVVDSPYWEYFCDLYDKHFNVELKLIMMDQAIELAERRGQSYKDEMHKVINEVVKFVTTNSAYLYFINKDMSAYNTVITHIPKRNIYHPDFDGKRFISFDLVKANFNVLRAVDDEIVNGCNTYENFIHSVTGTQLPYYLKSKQIRQVIFGHLNPKRQQTVQKHYIAHLAKMLNVDFFPTEYFINASADELIVQPPRSVSYKQVDEAVQEWSNINNIPVRITRFTLHQLKPYPFYVRVMDDGWDLKNVPLTFHAQTFKHITGQSVVDNDLIFYHEKQIARFLTPLEFEKGVSLL